MTERASRSVSRDRRIADRQIAEPGAAETHEAIRLAFELGCAVRSLREQRGWSQTHLAQAAGMTQSAVARFEAGGSVPTLPVLERLAHALDVDLSVRFTPRTSMA
jgi:ribosome-binding protein aMBF1 (putative translation factor)